MGLRNYHVGETVHYNDVYYRCIKDHDNQSAIVPTDTDYWVEIAVRHQYADAAGVTDHGALTGLADDDHTQYRLESDNHSHATSGAQGGTVSHGDLTSVTADQHHNKSHGHTGADGSGTVAGADLTGTPGGELGGTWASPTVDSTHAGSAHLALGSSEPGATSTTSSGSAGSAGTASKSDHAHDLGFDDATSNPLAVSTAAADGTEGSAARKDHVHAHEAAHLAHDTLWDTKGDIVVATGADTASKLAAGADGLFLKADSGQTTGLIWAASGGSYAASIGDASATSFNVDHNLGTLDVLVQVFQNSDGVEVEASVTRSTTNRVVVAFTGITPSSNQFRVVVQK